MKTWVHRIKDVDGSMKFLTNEDFREAYHIATSQFPKDVEWTPFKVMLPDDLKAEEDPKTGQITIENLRGERVSLESVLGISEETGGPVIDFHDPEINAIKILEEVDR